jgi:hypothetical protein
MSLTAPRGRLLRVTVLALVITVGGTAWAFAGRSGKAMSATGHPVVSPAELSERLPFYAIRYAQTPVKVTIARAQRQLTVSCMKEHGFRYEPVPISEAAGSAADHPLPFGLESLAGPAEAATGAMPSETPVSKAFTLALYGDPDDRVSAKGKLIKVSVPGSGCQAEAEKKLLGDQRLRRLKLSVQLGEGEQEARKQLEKDPAFRAANARWRQCMRAAGFTQKDPESLLRSLARDADLAMEPAARADVRCKGDTDYLTTAYARLRVAQQAWLDRHAGMVTTWNALQRRQDSVARDVLGAR